ncbi:MAG: PhnD/SsuA/transferrin family substrate-binding protein [Acidimicrobiales bacterium]|nr:PhnD/SsuA/transferrin family substrate-binding protein [Acidimicrobiales bacterium]
MRMISYMAPGFPEELFEVLAGHIGASVEYETARSGPAPGDDPFGEGGFDFGWICSTSYVDLHQRGTNPSIRLAGVAWVPDDADSAGRPMYFGDVVVRADSPVQCIADLAGRRVGVNDPVSLSGFHALRLAIEQLGEVPESFADLTFTGGHHISLDQVAAGEIDAAVVDSVVRIGRSRHDDTVAALRIVDRLGPWPVQPLVVRSDMDDHVRARVQRALLDANADPAVQRQLERSALTELVAVGPDHYDGVRRVFSGQSLG